MCDWWVNNRDYIRKKGINILSVKGILIGISVGIVFVLILGFLFSFI